ncbi:BTAD domain-containing putative transcriptional regulator [Pseudonocardia broussonetiae]|uniref:AAA family ATPase n=1 Tax=Pseudonocardia broussonetiae TaxID=2736640 RepID=A0A6M6JBB6_9PSEU|nr:BTAD domain-containing putative transcriptional regulator [Pseudonocardia broussonetiae]QJY45228.1 AAA family ATPase [Pseudonocardia broussonetiae]
MQLQLLGRFQVRRDGREVPPAAFGGRKVRALLRVLAVRRPDLVPHDVLAEALWPDRLPADPAANLGVLVNRARRALGDPALIVTGTGGYALGDCEVDAGRFLAAVEASRTADTDGAVLQAASTALALWGEPLPEDSYAEWASEPRERLHRARVEAAERAAGAALALGDPRRASSWAADAVAAEPLRESATLVLAEALAAAGDPAAALARLADLRVRLSDELGVDPSAAVDALRLALLRGAGPAVVRVSAPAPAAPRVFGEPVFSGRAEELVRLRTAVDARQVAGLAGVAGAGKSRLLAELTRSCPLPVLAARAFLPERAEAWGLARSLLREALATDAAVADTLPPRVRHAVECLLPEWGSGSAAAVDGESGRALLLAGGLRVLEVAAGTGAVLVVDDLQWADPSSVLLLGSALARLPQLAAVFAFRGEELAPSVMAELRGGRPGDDVVLGPLPVASVGRMVGHDELASTVAAATDGTPFAVVEVLRELVRRDAVVPFAHGWQPRSPDVLALAAELGREGQRRTLRRRVARQGGVPAEVLAVLALLAREAPASTIASACGSDPRAVLDALSALAAAGLVRLGERGWATAHDLVAETVVAGMDAGGRGRLHGLLARALDAEDADPSETARHHRDAGNAHEAALAFARAAAASLAAHATGEATAMAVAGLALDPPPALRADLLAVRAEADAGTRAALTDLRAALSATGPGPLRSRRMSRLAMLTFGAEDPHRAAELAELAIVEAAADAGARAFALETAAILDMNLGRPDRGRDRAEAALDVYRVSGDAAGVARILDGRAMATFLDGRIAAGVETFGRVAQLFTDSGELLRVVTPRSTRGHGLVFLGRPADGLAEATAALHLARDLDAPERCAYALWHRSEALSALGETAEAEADAREALATARGVDHRGWTATAHRALGIALVARGELDDAAAEFAASSAAAGESLTLFASWAAARAALVAVARGALAGVDEMVARALATGPPLGHYEARLAEVELLAAREDPGTAARSADALTVARDGGHTASVERLVQLSGAAGPHPDSSRGFPRTTPVSDPG